MDFLDLDGMFLTDPYTVKLNGPVQAVNGLLALYSFLDYLTFCGVVFCAGAMRS